MKILAGVFATFEDMCWTIPTQRMEEIVHKVYYGQPTKNELSILAGAVSSYAALIQMPEKLRRVRIRQLREALKLAASQVPTDDRRPPPPDELVGALQDRVHKDIGESRPGKAHRDTEPQDSKP